MKIKLSANLVYARNKQYIEHLKTLRAIIQDTYLNELGSEDPVAKKIFADRRFNHQVAIDRELEHTKQRLVEHDRRRAREWQFF